MSIKKVNSDAIKLYKTSQVKFKVAGNTREVRFTAGNNNRCPIQNISKDKYLDKETGEAYLSDMEYEEDNIKSGIVVKKVDGKNKKFIKGEWLKYYPTGMPLFSASRGMKRPVMEKISNKEAMECVSDCELVYRETYAIGDENKRNIIDKRYYKNQES